MKTIYNKYDKNKINALPQVLFPGKIVVVQSESEADIGRLSLVLRHHGCGHRDQTLV